MDGEIIIIRVGAKEFKTRRSTIDDHPDCTLAAAIRFGNTTDFWDRDEECFQVLLNYLRNGFLAVPPGLSTELLARELEFWGFTLEYPLAPDQSPAPYAIPCSLGMSLQRLAQGTDSLLACVCWRAIRRLEPVWEAASIGYRSIRIFWIQSSTSHINAAWVRCQCPVLSRLSWFDGCTLEMMEPARVEDIGSISDSHDVVTRGQLVMESRGLKTLHHHTFQAALKTTQRSVTFYADAPQSTSFLHAGCRVHMDMTGCELRWRVETVEGEGPHPAGRIDPAAACIMEAKILFQDTIFNLFVLPTCRSRIFTLEADYFTTTKYTIPDDAPADWFLAGNRARYADESYLDYGVGDKPGQATLVIDVYPHYTLKWNPIGSYVTDCKGYCNVMRLSWGDTAKDASTC